jgi:hypothetical protein
MSLMEYLASMGIITRPSGRVGTRQVGGEEDQEENEEAEDEEDGPGGGADAGRRDFECPTQ